MPLLETLWTCTIPGRPGTKGNSHRIMKRGNHMSVSPSASSQQRERAAREVIASERPAAPFAGPLVVEVSFVFAIPASRRKGKDKVSVGDPCLLRVDRGNLLKLIEDAMNGLVYDDDSQVVGGNVSKVWGETSGTKVTVFRAVGTETSVAVAA